jgi:hypothetical protein
MRFLIVFLFFLVSCGSDGPTIYNNPNPSPTPETDLNGQTFLCSSEGGDLVCEGGEIIPLPPAFPHKEDCNECVTTVENDVATVECPNGLRFQFTLIKGEKGEDGEDGEDGSSCSVYPDGWVRCTDGTEYKLERGPKGEKGDKGDQGEKGEKGDPGETIIIHKPCDDCWSFGAHGNVYTIPHGTNTMPDYDSMEPEETVKLDQFDIFDRSSYLGFPGLPHRLTWYGIKFTGYIHMPECEWNLCEFRLTSDDGAILYIGGEEVVNNDGLQPPTAEVGTIAALPGWHEFRLDWYQGPHRQIAIALEISQDGGDTFRLVEYTELRFKID